jgi:hypothetical protein
MLASIWRRSINALVAGSQRGHTPLWPSQRGAPQLECLEDRLTPATFAAAGPQLGLTLDTADEAVSIVTDGSTCTLTLTGGTWSGTDSANVTGNGTALLTVTAAGLAAFDTVALTDSAANTSVAFDASSGSYTDNFLITLDDAAAGEITFSGNTSFSNANLSATATRNVVVNAGATVEGTGTAGITLEGNQQAAATTGSFVGIDNVGTIRTENGTITLRGRGGDDAGGSQHGIFNDSGGTITSVGSGSIILDGTGGSGADSDGVRNGGTISSTASGDITITGSITSGEGIDSEGFANEQFGTVDSSAGSGDITVNADVIFLFTSGGATVNAATNSVTILPTTSGRDINLGDPDDPVGSVGLTNGELNTITASTLTIGDTTLTGTITINGGISLANVTTLNLTTGSGQSVIFNDALALGSTATTVAINTGSVTSPGVATADVTVASLSVTASTGIGTSTDPLTISVSNLAAGTSTGDIFVSSRGGVTLNGVSATAGNISIGAVEASPTDVLSMRAGTTVVAGGSIVLGGADGVNLPASAAILAGTSVTLNVGTSGGDSDGSGSLVLGTISGTSAAVMGGGGLDVVTVGLANGQPLNVSLGNNDDTLALAAGKTLNGGTFDGGTGTDTLDYSAYTTAVSVDLGQGIATGTAGISNVEKVFGGSAADSLTAGPSDGFFAGGQGNDTFTWSSGDGNLTVDGGTGSDTFVLNTAAAGNSVQLGSSGNRLRIDVAGSPSITILTSGVESATVDGGAGNDTLRVNSLAGVASLTAVNLNGGAGNDTFTVAPAAVPISVSGGTGTDALVILTAGTTDPFLTITSDNATGLAGSYTFGNRANVTFAQVESLQSATNFLTVTNTDGLATTPPGTPLTDTVTVTNNSGLGINGVTVTDAVPASLSSVTWTAAFTSGSTGTASGSGSINEVVNLAAGGSVTYVVTGTSSPTATGTLTNTAAAALPAGLTDNTPADNTATDTTSLLPPPPLAQPQPPAEPGPLIVGGSGGTAAVFTADPATGWYAATPTGTVSPFGSTGGTVRSATADVDGDGIPDIILATGPGTQLLVAVVSGADNTTLLVRPFAPFAGSEGFTGGGFVAAADLDGDGKAEWVVTPDRGGGPRVTVFSLVNGAATVRANFLGIDDPSFRGGARAALGDVTQDGKPDLAVVAGFLGGPRAALFDGRTLLGGSPTQLVNDFFAFPGSDAVTLRNGVFVAIGDVNGDGFGDLIFGGGPGGAPRVFILSGAMISVGNTTGAQAAPLANFYVAGNTSARTGVGVAAKDVESNRADVATSRGDGTPGSVRVYSGATITPNGEPSGFQDLDLGGGGVFVG